MGIDLHDLSYLADGTPRQRDALRVIRELRLWEHLAAYTPALAGTVPLGIDVEDSDLDVICEADNLTDFLRAVISLASVVNGLCFEEMELRHVPSMIVRFRYGGWAFELFAQPVPVARQYACVHLRVEERLLALGGKPARDAIRELKRDGWGTEQAFAVYFGIAGDPYEEVARLADAGDEELRRTGSRAL
jgi:hypothetical protein